MNKRSKIDGWDKVFSFAFTQNIKSKSYILSTLIMIVVLVAGIIYTATSKTDIMDANSMLTVDLDKAYLYNETSLKNIKLDKRLCDISKNYDKTKVEEISSMGDDIENDFEKFDDCDDSILVHLYQKNEGYTVDIFRTSDSNVSDFNTSLFADDVKKCVTTVLYDEAGIEPEQLNFLTNDVKSNTVSVDASGVEDEKKETTDNFMSNTTIGTVILMFMVFILAMGGENASTAMITEKGSRVIEYVLTSVRPNALIVGKIMASVASQFLQIALMIGACAVTVFGISHYGSSSTSVGDMLYDMGMGVVVDNMSATNVIIALLVMIAGIILYVIIAALIGSTASKMEELSQTNMIYSVILIVGVYTAMILTLGDYEKGSFIQKFVLAFPLSSPFVMPSFLVAGDCTVTSGIVSLVILLIAIILMILLVAKVFESVILYTGSKVTFSKLLEMAGIKKKKHFVKAGDDNE